MEWSVISSRLQPLHHGHVQLWRRALLQTRGHLLICVIDIPLRFEEAIELDESWRKQSAYFTLQSINNPIPLIHRLQLVQKATADDAGLRDRCIVLPRLHPALGFEASLDFLPEDRVFVFDPKKSDHDSRKAATYRAHGERVVELVSSAAPVWEGRSIRQQLRDGSRDLSFLPESCREYFALECTKYFQAHGG